jgi:hypothetical protein
MFFALAQFGLNIGVTAYNLAQTTGIGAVINVTSIVLSGAIFVAALPEGLQRVLRVQVRPTGR